MAKKKAPAKTHFVLYRLNWQAFGKGVARLPGKTRLRSFAGPDEAEEERRRLEAEARGRVNPFTCGGRALHYQTSLDEGRLHDWLLDAGLDPPAAGKKGRDWARWWEDHQGAMTELRREQVWKALDKVRFYEVVEQPAREVGYVVVHINYHYNDEFFVAEPEGGTPITVFRDRKKAEEDCASSNGSAQDLWAEDHENEFDTEERRARQGDPFQPPRYSKWGERLRPAEAVPFYEVIEVELDDL